MTRFTDVQSRGGIRRCNFLTREGSTPAICRNLPDVFLGFRGVLGGQHQSGVSYCASHAAMIIGHVRASSDIRSFEVVGVDAPGLEKLVENRIAEIRARQIERAEVRSELG